METLLSAAMVFVPVVLLVSIRVGVALAAMPAPFGDLAPVTIRAALGVLVALAIGLPYSDQVQDLSLSALALARGAVGEVIVGTVIGLTVRVTLAAVQIAGTFAGFSMGLGFARSIDPMLGEESVPTSRLLGAFAALIFIVLNGHHVVLSALSASLTLAPPGNAFAAITHAGIVSVGAGMLGQALRIAAPVVATMFIVALGTGLISRAAPRVHIFSLSFAVAAAVGTMTLFVAAPSLATAIAVQTERLPAALVAALGGR